tara:strand:+ start:614 stop:1327 length:714 start_codon:yes stop_codon:yes gene_type:complete
MLRILFSSIYYQTLIFLRIKIAVFFTFIFPIVIFVVFGNIWGGNGSKYFAFLLSGIIGMTVASDGLNAVGSIIKDYYSSGLLKYLRKLPFNIILHFMGLIISRVLSLLFIIIILCIVSRLMFDHIVSLSDFFYYILGTLIGLFTFSFIGLVLNFIGIKYESTSGITNLFYFIMLFTSDAFYPASSANNFIGIAGNSLPLNPILHILRNEGYYWNLLPWLVIPPVLFYFIFHNLKTNR